MVERSVALEGDHETDANERPLGSSCKRVVSMIFLKEWTLLSPDLGAPEPQNR
jgi:hypothetical protein